MAVQPSIRERTRRAVRAEIATAAMHLFKEQGFDETTVDQIATEAGISRRSFFHYFANKEDLVLGDTEALGESVREALEARPAEESAWTAIRAALMTLQSAESVSEDRLVLARLYRDAPSLRARHLEKHLRWQESLAPEIHRRLGLPDAETPDPRARAFVAAALACLDTAVEAWCESDGAADPVQLFDDAVAAIRT